MEESPNQGETMAYEIPLDAERCAAKNKHGERCRLRRVPGLADCEVHSDLLMRFESWLYTPSIGDPENEFGKRGRPRFDVDREAWEGGYAAWELWP